MPVLRAKIFGVPWLLADRHGAMLFELSHAAVQGMVAVRDFVNQVDRSALARLLNLDPWRATAADLERALLWQIERGSMRLMRESRPLPKLDPGVRIEPPALPPEPAPDLDPVNDDPRALFITRCEPELGLEQPLRFSYLMRGLAGRPATLRISSKTYEGRVVHERSLAPAATTDGVHDGEWDGRVTTSGDWKDRRLPAKFGPCVLEIVHDKVYCDDAPFTIAEPDFVIEFADLHFATDREILLPLTEDPDALPDTPRVTPLQVIAVLLEFAADHPERQVVVYGHADTAGKAAHNDELSEARARNVQLYLAGDRQQWAAACQEHYEIADFKRVHRWAADRFGWATDPGPLDNEWTTRAKHARAEFRTRCDELLGTSLEQGVKQNENDWTAIFDLYDIAVAAVLGCKPEDLGVLRDMVTYAEPAILGCGEHWPVLADGQDGVAERLNRRVEVMFFQPDELPAAHGSEQPAGDELYASGRYKQIRLEPFGSDEALLRIALLDEYGDAMPQARFTVETRSGLLTGTADGSGVATVPRALVDVEVSLSWKPADSDMPEYASVHALMTDGKTEQGLRQRLANLGFEWDGHDLERPVVMFQRFLGLPPSGKLGDVRDLINDWYSTGERPTPDPDQFDYTILNPEPVPAGNDDS